ncbi:MULTISPECIES: hypothetical protein [unclassified Curtobacterium]|uniref:hypothetical protein n=1 Tax=unclassified Curtobacterium TaxID=257496 RepID=UPI003A80A1C0
MAYVPENPTRLRIVVEADIAVTDREALLSAALAWNDDLHAADSTTAIMQLLRLNENVPGLRVLGSSLLPRAIEGDEYVAMTLPSMPVQ